MRNLTATLCLTLFVLLGSAGMSFALPECEESPLTGSGSDVRLWDNCEGTHIFGPLSKGAGDKYVGEWRDGKPDGHGTFTVGNLGNQGKFAGIKYVGEYRDGKRNGHFTVTYPSGNKYVGEYRDNKRHGQGTYTYPSGNKYVGEYRNGKRNGQGTFTYADGRIKEGIWENGKFKYAQKASPTQKQPEQGPSNFPLDKAEKKCAEIGFTKGTEKYGDCVMKLLN